MRLIANIGVYEPVACKKRMPYDSQMTVAILQAQRVPRGDIRQKTVSQLVSGLGRDSDSVASHRPTG